MDFLEKNKDITELSNFKTPARAKYYFEVNSEKDLDQLKSIYDFANLHNVKILVVWGGTNLLFAFDEFDGIVIKNNLKGWFYDDGSKILVSYSAESIWEIAENLEFEYKQKLWHRFIGLPGSVWGAVFWNAGCFWLETESNFLEAEVLNMQTWKREHFTKEKMEFDYRTSKIKNNEKYFIIKVVFDLFEKSEKYASDVDNIKFRNEVQPKWNSCWSFFKNPSKELSAWKLLEDVWMKWFHQKWAYFSEKHANFLMSDGKTCTWQDLVSLIKLAQEKVKKQYHIDLENEVRIITN